MRAADLGARDDRPHAQEAAHPQKQYATGRRASELVGAMLGMIEMDAAGDHWLKQDNSAGITATRLWAILKRFFSQVPT